MTGKDSSIKCKIMWLLLAGLIQVTYGQWEMTNGPASSYIQSQSLAAVGTNLFVATTSGIFLSSDSGTTWTNVNAPFSYLVYLAAYGTTIVANSYNGIIISKDYGKNWTKSSTGLPNDTTIEFTSLAVTTDNNGSHKIFIGSAYLDDPYKGQGVFVSSNDGMTWLSSSIGLPDSTEFDYLSASGTKLIGGGSRYSSYLSNDNGVSWGTVKFANYSYLHAAKALAQIGNTIFAGTDGSGVFISTDNGTSWTAASSGLNEYHINAFLVSGVVLFAATNDGVYLSTNKAISWTPCNFGMLPQTQVVSFAEIGNYLFAAGNLYGDPITGGYVFRASLGNLPVVHQQAVLLQNRLDLVVTFSDPCSQLANVVYNLPTDNRVNVSIYSVSGKLLETLAEGTFSAGVHWLTWNSRYVQPGCYFMRLVTARDMVTRRIALLR